MVFGVYENPDKVGVPESLLIALIAILIVFMTLIVIIAITFFFQKGMDYVSSKLAINPRKENKILEEDEDAVVAALTATIDFHKETGKDARLISITRED